jgi:glucose-6-phosphate isomerase
MNKLQLWQRYQQYLCACESIGMKLDISRMAFGEAFLAEMSQPMAAALAAMEQLERGHKANVDENRMVGHYWLRAPELAPDARVGREIETTVSRVRKFAADVHSGAIRPQRGDGFYVALVIGIGGSALGPQFVCDALGGDDDAMAVRFIDNTDPDGIDRALGELAESLDQTLTIVISKSGGTKETHNGMLEVAAAYKKAGLSFAKHALAITGDGSELHKKAIGEKWLATFPMLDWVGGRTSVTSAVGLLPAALQGIDIEGLLAGARQCDQVTRQSDTRKNPAALLALMWHYAGKGRGERAMVVLPYRDRLLLFGRYLQQLVMESIGKELNRKGQRVEQGLTAYGNKGSTDQHAFVQQLRDGHNDFFVTFIEVLRDRTGTSIQVEPDVTSGDYLMGFMHGTRAALAEKSRESITITFNELKAHSLGALIALFERAVGLYAELIDVNAYHQPGVEAGKKAASAILSLQSKALAYLRGHRDRALTAEEIAEAIGAADEAEALHHILEHAAANPDHGIARTPGSTPPSHCYRCSAQ